MSQVIDSLERAQLRQVPDFDPGDRVRVHFQVIEGTRRRTQLFEGTVIKRQGQGARETFTVRKQSFGVGVERTFPVHSPKIEELEVASRGDVRRAKLYYLRGRVGRRARVKERQDVRGRAARAAIGTNGPPDAVDPAELDAELELQGTDGLDAAAGADTPPDSDAVESDAGESTPDVLAADEDEGPRRTPSRRPPRPAGSRATTRARRAGPPAAPDAAPRPIATAARQKGTRPGGSLGELVLIVVVALGLALGIQAFIVKPFKIPSESMVPTLEVGQRVLVDRVSYRLSDPKRGDVVVFKPPAGADVNVCGVEPPPGQACARPTEERSDTNFIKRIVGEPGDRLKVIRGQVFINGGRQQEPYARPSADCPICSLPKEITVPPGHFFMMGDNRGESADSRAWGPVPEDWIIGGAFATYWPPKRIGKL